MMGGGFSVILLSHVEKACFGIWKDLAILCLLSSHLQLRLVGVTMHVCLGMVLPLI